MPPLLLAMSRLAFLLVAKPAAAFCAGNLQHGFALLSHELQAYVLHLHALHGLLRSTAYETPPLSDLE